MKPSPFDSFQHLRGIAHWLLEELFPSKPKRYAWLRQYAPRLHMSQMTKPELKLLIAMLEERKRTGECFIHKKNENPHHNRPPRKIQTRNHPRKG